MASEKGELLRVISSLLAWETPVELVPSTTAGVAVLFGRSGEGEDRILLIKRADRTGDPWSGHVALPGGRVEGMDGSFRGTAVRETLEEVGIDLDAGGRFLGYMGKFHARTRRILVVPSVFVADHIPDVTPSPEVASYRWVPFNELLRRGNTSSHTVRRGKTAFRFPAYEFEDYHIWGVTERILSTMVGAARGKGLES